MSRKRVLSQETGGATELKSLPTPINLFEDECVFCHSFRTSQVHGPMVRHLKGRVVSIDKGNSSDAIYVHKKCLEWASGVWFKGDTVMGFESEIRRASKLLCTRCGVKGAALGCYYDPCLTSFHVPCAVLTIGCRWDYDGYMLCPEHVSNALPCDKLGTHAEDNYNSSSLCPSRRTDKEGNSDYHNGGNQQTVQLSTSNASSLPQSHSSHEEGTSTNSLRDGKQTDQLNSSQPSQKAEISTNSSRDNQQIDQLDTSSSSSLPLGQHSYDKGVPKNHEMYDQQRHNCHPDKEEISKPCQMEEMKSDQPNTCCPSDQLVLFGLFLSVEEKDFVQKFACWTDSTVMKEWAENVTHVILGKGAGSSWRRSFEALMGILLGKWVIRFEWIADCLQLSPGPEASYEVAAFTMDSLGTVEGPKQGRIRASEGAPRLFSGLCFCLSDHMIPDNRDRVRDLIAAAGGRVLEKRDLRLLPLEDPDGGSGSSSSSSAKPRPYYFVYDVDAPRETECGSSSLRREMEEAREQAAAGAQVISHLAVLDAVAAFDAAVLNVSEGRFATS